MRGRGWIALIGLALMGVVFMQVSLLKLNTGIGRPCRPPPTLERQNAELRGEVALLDGGERCRASLRRWGCSCRPPARCSTSTPAMPIRRRPRGGSPRRRPWTSARSTR
jgi:hypothetical protein